MTESDHDLDVTDERREATWALLGWWCEHIFSALTDGTEGDSLSGGVLSGPFKGMTYSFDSGVHDTLPKLIGCYEEELHTGIEAAINLGPRKIINVGAAEGYYSTGFARRLPEARVIAYEMQKDLRPKAEALAQANGVADRIEIRGLCTLDELVSEADEETLVFMDCEGCEADLLDPVKAPNLAKSIILLELHDFIRPGVSKDIMMRFARSHRIETYQASGRDPFRYPGLKDLPSFHQMLAMCEYRPAGRMQWMLLTPHR